ncbi:MAG: Dps family protein [Aeromonas sp.]
MKSSIGLEHADSQTLVAELNSLLASYQIFYMNVRGFHWNIRGPQFFELHLKFEEIYNDLLLKVDAIAERILTLEGEPLHSFSDYLHVSLIAEAKNHHQAEPCIQALLTGFAQLLSMQRHILTLAHQANDEGTDSLLSGYISEQEKLVWMLRAYLNA